jgi:hypothetical protein
MSWNALVNPLTKQFYPDLIPGGGGGGQVNSITGGAGINIAGTAVNPQVNLAFTAAGEIMVGTGALAGAPLPPLLNGILSCVGGTPSYIAPGAGGEVLTITGGVPGYAPVGGSGLITATPPLVESAVGTASNIAINFAAKGDIPVGTGAAAGGLIGVGPDGAVLTADSTAAGNPYGMKWSVPTGSGSVQRITTPGTTTIAAPTQLNQQLQLIDTASTTNTFIFEKGAPHPSGTFVISGTFSNLIGGVFKMVVYGNDPAAAGGPQGQVWYYEPNILTPANGIWTLIIGTTGGSLSCGCLKNPDPTVNAGYSACDMVFGGTFNGGEYVPTGTIFFGATNFFYLSNAGVVSVPNFTNYSINPFPSGLGICGVATNANAGAIAFIAFSTNKNGSLKVNVGATSVEYNGIALITTAADIVPLQGGTTGLPGTPPTSGVFASATNVQFINNLRWTFDGNLAIVGGFERVSILGNVLPNSSDIVFLTYDPTPASIAGFIAPAPPFIGGSFNGTIADIRPTYDPTIGSLIAGDFSQGPSTNIVFLSPAGAVQQLEVSSESDYYTAIGIDGGSYVGGLGFGGQLYGYSNGFAQAFGGVQISLDWFIPKIAQGFPLSFIGADNRVMYQGYFKTTGNTTTIHFTPAKVRYSLPSGSSGLASFAVLNSFYSSLTLIGDTTAPPPYVWDLVGYTGNISFS